MPTTEPRPTNLAPGCARLLLFFLTILTSAHASAQSLPTVRFTRDSFTVLEGTTRAPIEVSISQRPQLGEAFVNISLTPVTATVGEDFTGASIIAFFNPVSPTIDTTSVQILDDKLNEGPETIALQIGASPFYIIGSPSTTILTIQDNDIGAMSASFEIEENVPLASGGRLVLATEAGGTVSVDVVLNATPQESVTIRYFDAPERIERSLVFAPGETRRTLAISATPLPPPPFVPVSSRTLTLLESTKGRMVLATRATQTTRASTVEIRAFGQSGEPSLASCFICFLGYIILSQESQCSSLSAICDARCPQDVVPSLPSFFPASVAALADDIALLRRYRDELLATTAGASYIALYDERSPDAGQAVLRNPTMFHRLLAAWELWRPAVTPWSLTREPRLRSRQRCNRRCRAS